MTFSTLTPAQVSPLKLFAAERFESTRVYTVHPFGNGLYELVGPWGTVDIASREQINAGLDELIPESFQTIYTGMGTTSSYIVVWMLERTI